MSTLTDERQLLDPAKVLHLLSPEGPIAKRFKQFEFRGQQQEMLANLVKAFNENAIALIEAGTGTGKSMAYLIPALLAASIWKEKVVISTHTIALQEQLLNKDLPMLLGILGITLKAVLVKGMGNYVCLRKWDEIAFDRKFLPPEDEEKLVQIENLGKQKGLGSKSDLAFNLPGPLWEMIGAEHETCNGAECSKYQSCYYVQARKNIQDAQIFIVNHHLLLADLIARGQSEGPAALLPNYQRLIIDEAHNLEDIATEYFAEKVSRLDLLKTLSKISSEKQGVAQGKLAFIKEKVHKLGKSDDFRATSQMLNRLTIDLPALRREILTEIANTFHLLEAFQKDQGAEEGRLRLRTSHYNLSGWKEGVAPQVHRLTSVLKRYAHELLHLETHINDLKDDRLQEATKGVVYDIKALSKRLLDVSLTMEEYVNEAPTPNAIRWLESHLTKGGLNIACVEAALDISKIFLQCLFAPFETVALLSATLTSAKSFAYLKGRMGLTGEALKGRLLIEASYDSPFDFAKQALLIVPKDIPLPTASDFLGHAEEVIWDAIQASSGNAFILFTSYGMLKACFQSLSQKLTQNRFYPLKQGDDSRGNLLKKFTEQNRSVLFGTSSFWEGIDVAGEALRLVIIAKLPFKVPTEPMVQARSEALQAGGRSPFNELLLPQAAIKFKQGFGRLIRNKNDRGCILCLDNRLISKSYGAYILETLPPCPLEVLEKSKIKERMTDFYKKTYYLTKK